MIDADESGRAVSIIDLDTVKPGLVQKDIDCLRSSQATLAEGREIDQVTLSLTLREHTPGVTSCPRSGSSTAPRITAISSMRREAALEMGLRFFTDYFRAMSTCLLP